MKIVQLIAHHVHIPLRKPIRHASHTRTFSANLVVRCVLDNGIQGFGEGVPRDYVTGETIHSALTLLQESDLAAQMEPCRDWNEVLALAERLQLAVVPGDDRQCQGNAARCAVELALLDAYGKHFGVPLSQVTAMLTPDLYAPQPWVRYSGAITSASGFKARLAAWKMWIYGFAQLKVKVGIEGQNDVDRLRTIRSRVGSKMDIRIDANEAWSPDQAAQRIQELEPFGISCVEQPIAHEKATSLSSELAHIRAQVQTPIMLDESLCSRVDAERAVAAGWCDLFNLRLSKCGGFIPSLRLAQFARQHQLGIQLGCQVGETALLSAAGRHFASSVADLRYREGSYDSHLVREALGRQNMTFGYGGWARALLGPGLGVDVDTDRLTKVTTDTKQIFG